MTLPRWARLLLGVLAVLAAAPVVALVLALEAVVMTLGVAAVVGLVLL